MGRVVALLLRGKGYTVGGQIRASAADKIRIIISTVKQWVHHIGKQSTHLPFPRCALNCRRSSSIEDTAVWSVRRR
jgi:hypothetical protein